MIPVADEPAMLAADNRRLKNQIRLFRAALGVLLLSSAVIAGVHSGSAADGATVGPVREPRAAETIILDVPAVKQVGINSQTIDYDLRTREYHFQSDSEVTWTNGVRLRARNARISLLKTSLPEPGTDGATRVLIEPLLPAGR